MNNHQGHWPSYPFFVSKSGDGKFIARNLNTGDEYPPRETYAEADDDATLLRGAFLEHFKATERQFDEIKLPQIT